MKKSKITSHILDVEKGRPAADVLITLEIKENGKWSQICQGKTDADGRVMDWAPEEINEGHYKISFDVQSYFSSQKQLYTKHTCRNFVDNRLNWKTLAARFLR